MSSCHDETQALADTLVALTEPWAALEDCVRVVLAIEAQLLFASVVERRGQRHRARVPMARAYTWSRRFVDSPVPAWAELAARVEQRTQNAS